MHTHTHQHVSHLSWWLQQHRLHRHSHPAHVGRHIEPEGLGDGGSESDYDTPWVCVFCLWRVITPWVYAICLWRVITPWVCAICLWRVITPWVCAICLVRVSSRGMLWSHRHFIYLSFAPSRTHKHKHAITHSLTHSLTHPPTLSRPPAHSPTLPLTH